MNDIDIRCGPAYSYLDYWDGGSSCDYDYCDCDNMSSNAQFVSADDDGPCPLYTTTEYIDVVTPTSYIDGITQTLYIDGIRQSSSTVGVIIGIVAGVYFLLLL